MIVSEVSIKGGHVVFKRFEGKEVTVSDVSKIKGRFIPTGEEKGVLELQIDNEQLRLWIEEERSQVLGYGVFTAIVYGDKVEFAKYKLGRNMDQEEQEVEVDQEMDDLEKELNISKEKKDK